MELLTYIFYSFSLGVVGGFCFLAISITEKYKSEDKDLFEQMFKDKSFYIVQLLSLISSGIITSAFCYDSDPTAWLLIITGAGAPSLLKQGIKINSSKLKLGGNKSPFRYF